MANKSYTYKSKQGFTLLELSIVLVIVGIILSMGLDIGSEMTDRANRSKTKSILNNIESAIVAYKRTHGSIPCPARRTDDIGSADFGTSTDCSAAAPAGTDDVDSESPECTSGADCNKKEVRVGVVPVKELNLPVDHMFDAWNNRITYAVIKDLATNSTDYSAYATAPDANNDASADTNGVIKIRSGNGIQITKESSKIMVAYVLASHGRDEVGAYNRAGDQPIACAGSSRIADNCETGADADNLFTDEEMFDLDGNVSYFDDIIRWKTKDKIDQESNEALVTTTGLPTCSEGQTIKYISGSWSCAADNNGTFQGVVEATLSGSTTTSYSLATYPLATHLSIQGNTWATSGSYCRLTLGFVNSMSVTIYSTIVSGANSGTAINVSYFTKIPSDAVTVNVTKTTDGTCGTWSYNLTLLK